MSHAGTRALDTTFLFALDRLRYLLEEDYNLIFKLEILESKTNIEVLGTISRSSSIC